jgi:cyclopropane-fatty-acyl-phospholipid synthase
MARAVARILPKPASGHLRLVLPNGDHVDLGDRHDGCHVSMTMHRWRALWRILRFGELGFSNGYIAGDWSASDLVGVLGFFLRNDASFARVSRSGIARILGHLRHRANANTLAGSRRNIAAHYDLGNAFYRLWLDEGMNYSSAIYAPGHSLEAAQQNKLKRIASHLDLSGGERILEIGCGWGALAQHLVRTLNVNVTGVTLSQSQLDYARGRLTAEIAAGKADIHLQDYRDISGRFDRIVSIEMFEAVGERYWPLYFEKLRSSLAQDGIAILQIITIEPSRFDDYRKRPDFIQRHIFPGGMLPTADHIAQAARKAKLEVTLQESFGESYARTLQEWRHRFLGAWQKIEPLGFDAHFRRMWEYYLAYCEVGFSCRAIDVSIFRLTHGQA